MRIEGKLSKWNDDRGFGFITPSQGGQEVFAHISSFPRDAQRPRLGERLTFEIEVGKNGKKQASHILCATRPTEKPYRLSEPIRPTERPYRLSKPSRRPNKPGLLGRILPIALLVALGAYGYGEFTRRLSPPTATTDRFSDLAAPVETSDPVASVTFQCDGRTRCSEMTSCAEAKFFLRNCPSVAMDGDGDGEPCEQQWCN
ncbi:MAG: cold-shock protein [Thiobacillus sp.]|nr:cold-shock protein [Thiobacillus sp.]